MSAVSLCVIVPVYNHPQKLAGLIGEIRSHRLPVILVDDGSDAETRVVIDQVAAAHAQVDLIRLAHNQGKGAAVISGFRRAHRDGYSHAIQVDADHQHDLADLPRFIEAMQAQPDHLHAGIPHYDDSVPTLRLVARYLTHVWVWINTLSFTIRDSMCGYRLYPLAPTMALLEQTRIAHRMNFDIEIIVRLYWAGVPINNLRTRVIYHRDVPSNFRGFRDNLAISWTHAQLFFGMLRRLPRLLMRRRR